MFRNVLTFVIIVNIACISAQWEEFYLCKIKNLNKDEIESPQNQEPWKILSDLGDAVPAKSFNIWRFLRYTRFVMDPACWYPEEEPAKEDIGDGVFESVKEISDLRYDFVELFSPEEPEKVFGRLGDYLRRVVLRWPSIAEIITPDEELQALILKNLKILSQQFLILSTLTKTEEETCLAVLSWILPLSEEGLNDQYRTTCLQKVTSADSQEWVETKVNELKAQNRWPPE